MNVPFNNKITKLSYENSGLDSPIGSLYDFQSAIVPRDELKPVQPYIIANINNPSENLRVGILTNKANLTFRLSPPSLPFDRPLVENQEDYIFFNYNQIMSMTVVSYLDEPLSKFTYLFDDAPILHNNRVLQQKTTRQLLEDTEYIIVSKETSQMYRGKYIHMVDTSSNRGALFEFKLDKLPFFVKIVLSDTSCNFYLNKEASLNRLSQISFIDQERMSLNVDNGRLVNKQRTLRKVRSSLRSRSTTKKPESCITILIVAHGIMDKKLKIDENLMRNVNISLMAGGSDIYGLGGNYHGSHVIVNNIDNDEMKYTITGDRDKTTMSIDMISRIYPYLLDKYNSIKKKCSEQFYIFQEITNYLKQLYKLFGIHTFPKQGEFGPNDMGLRDLSLMRQRRIPFTNVTSFNDKKLYFQPNPYQNCRGYGTITRKEDCVLLEPQEKRELSYGITILQSSDPSDENYTLAGISKNGEDYRNATLTDWTQDQVRLYWAQNLVLNTGLLSQNLFEYYMNIYDIMSTPIDPNGIYDYTTKKRYVTLTQVIELFKYGMGFTNVNIIDYSCNSCSSPLTNMKRALIDVNASHPTMKLYREIKNEARNRIEDPEEYKQFMMNITNPSTQQIIEIVGEKAKSTSYDKMKKKSMRGKSFGGKNKTKRMKRRHKR